MPRQLPYNMRIDDIEDEIHFTRVALDVDPDAKELLPITDGWLAELESTQAEVMQTRKEVVSEDARRAVAGFRLERAAAAFEEELAREAGGVHVLRQLPKWHTFYPLSETHYSPLYRLGTGVHHWVGYSGELEPRRQAVLDKHRPELLKWLDLFSGAGWARLGSPDEGRRPGEYVSSSLTHDPNKGRAALHDALKAKALQVGLPVEWAARFFKTATGYEPGEQPTYES